MILVSLCGNMYLVIITEEPSWPWSYGSWIYNYLCNRCLSHWCCEFDSHSGRGVKHYVIVCQWLAAGQWFSPVSSTNNITEILLKVVLNTIKPTREGRCEDGGITHSYHNSMIDAKW